MEDLIQLAHINYYKFNVDLNSSSGLRYSSLILLALLQSYGEGKELQVSTHDDYGVDVLSNDSSLTEESSIRSYSLLQHESCDRNGCIDSEIWFPPEPKHLENDIEDSVASYGDVRQWARAVSISFRFKSQRIGSLRKKYERIGRMIVAMEAKFEEEMRYHLMGMGISGDNTWADIVTKLSWDAVSCLKPDVFLGKVVNPNSYVKVKCSATGSRSQSKVFKEMGLMILLRGCHSDELKNIKAIAQIAVCMAYRSIHEALFYLRGAVIDSPRDMIFSNCNEALMEHKDDITAVLGSGGISVFISRRNATRGTACKQTLSDIKLYRNFDMPFGMFLSDDLFNQELLCGTCNELPEAHIYYFTHHHKRIAVQVKRLPSDKQLPRENEGKLWVWCYCGQCDGSLKYTKRELVTNSPHAPIPSIQNFLIEAFNDHSFWETPSECGHFYRGDNSVFLGVGSMVSRFRFSSVATYSVSLPLRKVEFSYSSEDLLKKEVDDVVQVGRSIFAEVENSLKAMESKLQVGSALKLEGSCKSFSDIKEMLKQDQYQFEVDMSNVSANNRVYKPLHLNHIQWKLSLHSYIWDQRIKMLLEMVGPQTSGKKQSCFEEKDTSVYSGGDGVLSLKSADPQGWIWRPFSEIQSIYLKDFQRGYLPRYEASSSHTTESVIYKRITKEGSRLHFPLGVEKNYIVSDYEDEFSSIIACALASLADRQNSSDVISSLSLQKISSFRSLNWGCFNFLMGPDGSSFCNPSEESAYSIFDGSEWPDCSGYHHPVISMGRSSNRAMYSVTCLFHKEFLDLRSDCGLSELDYISSLSRCKRWDAKGGKSKSFFAKTLDDRFIIKQINTTEFFSFHEFAFVYFAYMNKGAETCLAKTLGVYQVTIKKTGAKYDLVVMENIGYGRKFARVYDLKGALYGRFNPATDAAGEVLLDQNYVYDMSVSPLYVNWKAEWNLQQAVRNDTSFLQSINVMDYSMLVGVDAENQVLVCGIIDYFRQFTLDKKLESWAKSSFMVPKTHSPTVIHPKEYKKRFIESMGHYVNDPISRSLQLEYKKVNPTAQICSRPTSL